MVMKSSGDFVHLTRTVCWGLQLVQCLLEQHSMVTANRRLVLHISSVLLCGVSCALLFIDNLIDQAQLNSLLLYLL